MATILRLPIPLTAATCAKERCIPRGKAASRRPRQGGVAARSTPPGGFIDFALVARRCWVAAVPLLARRRPVLLRFTAREQLRPLQRRPPHARHLPHRSPHSLPPPAPRRPRRTPATTLNTPYASCSPLLAAASPTAPHARRPRLPAVASPTDVTLNAPPQPDARASILLSAATGMWWSGCCRGGPTLTARPPPPPPTSRGRPPPCHPSSSNVTTGGVHMPASAGKGSQVPVWAEAATTGSNEDSIEASCEHCPLSSTHRPRVRAIISQLVGCTWCPVAYFLS